MDELRLGHRPLFCAGREDLTLRCYELAKFYGCDPDAFLDKPLSRVERTVRQTALLIKRIKDARE
ncbi:MAG TPA: hypothetical protein VKW08_07820 [Xanthobacteraceae bacterium]|nr:hypothetical protein [Xanthobacteraceae bacterium]